jgi:TetR/AcrR family fatty acid metabolism transcriptional regulator
VAKRLLVERGFRGTRLDDIASEAGCAKGALYLEFPDKETLLRDVLHDAFDGVRARFASQVVPIRSPLDRLVATLEFAFHEHAREPLFARLLREDPEMKVLGLAEGDRDRQQAQAQSDQLVAWAADGIERGEIRPDFNPRLMPLVIGVLRHAPMHTPLLAVLGASGDDVLRAILEIFRAGLADPAHRPKIAMAAAARASAARPASRSQARKPTRKGTR